MGKQRIIAPKGHRFIPVMLHYRDTFTIPGAYPRLSQDRIVGLDSESLRNRDYGGELRTNLVPLDFADPSRNVMLETRGLDYPFESVSDHIFPMFAEHEENPSRTKQRPRRERTDGKYRDGDHQCIKPVVLIMFNLEYDLGRLFRNHPQFQRTVTSTMDSVRIQVGKYEVEIRQLTPSGNAASFEFRIRYNHMIMRIIGRDAWAYIKSTLEEAAECFLNEQKDELDKDTFDRIWEELTESELAKLKEYAAKDARLTRELYEMLITLLTSIDEHVICRNGILPKSPAGAAAKMAFAMASREEWKRPPRHVMEMGALSYAGGRVFNRKPGYYEHINVYDEDSAHMFIMAQLPDPCTCIYRDIKPGDYVHADWRGKYGCMLIDGEGTDQYYPALRAHDEENQRLRYVYGPFSEPFSKMWATIPEIVIGVQSGRLRVDHIHQGVWIDGSSEDSFLRKHSLKMYELKQKSDRGTPMYILAKLLGISLAGKLAEVSLDKPYFNLKTGAVPFPNVPEVWSEAYYRKLCDTYIQRGFEGIEEMADELIRQHHYAEDYTEFLTIINHHKPAVGKAGVYYLPMHAAQITGTASARLGLFAHCTNAISGHTDSAFTIGNQAEGIKRFHEIERAAGYESPEAGMGSFRQEVEDGHGVLLKGNLYAVKYRTIDRETGEVQDHEKCATHGLPGIDSSKTTAYDMIMHLHENDEIKYETKPAPRTLMMAAMLEKEPGVFKSHLHYLRIVIDPNMTTNDDGERVWKLYTPTQHSRIIHHYDNETLPPDIEYQPPKSSKYSLNQDTTPSAAESSSLHEATRYRSSSGLNMTRPSEAVVKSPRENVSRAKKEDTLPSTTALNGSMRSKTSDKRLSESACKNPQAGSSPYT